MSYKNTINNSVKKILDVDILRRHSGLLITILSLLVGLTLWQIYTSGQPEYLFPGLEAIYSAFLTQLREYSLLPVLANSLLTLFVGYVLAAVVGVCIGIAMGLNEHLENLLNPYINAMYVAPIAALVPILILLGGSTFGTRVLIVFLFAVFEIIIDSYEGVKATPESSLEVARSFGADRWFIIRNVIVPYDLPYIMTGLRLGIGRGIKGMIIGELLIEFTNMGKIIRLWANNFRIEGVLSAVIVLMIIGVLLINSVKYIGQLLFPWQKEVDV